MKKFLCLFVIATLVALTFAKPQQGIQKPVSDAAGAIGKAASGASPPGENSSGGDPITGAIGAFGKTAKDGIDLISGFGKNMAGMLGAFTGKK